MKNDNIVKIGFMGGLEVGSNLCNWAMGSIPSLEALKQFVIGVRREILT